MKTKNNQLRYIKIFKPVLLLALCAAHYLLICSLTIFLQKTASLNDSTFIQFVYINKAIKTQPQKSISHRNPAQNHNSDSFGSLPKKTKTKRQKSQIAAIQINEKIELNSVEKNDQVEDKKLDLHALRAQILENERNRKKTPQEALRESQFIAGTIEVRIAKAAKQAERKDCQTAYAGFGLFAIIPLTISSISDKGCKWK